MYAGQDICENCLHVDFKNYFILAFCPKLRKYVHRFDH